MSQNVTFNGTSYVIPEQGESSWGTNVTSYLVAIASHALQKTGGSFTLTADVDFGATFGLKAVKFSSRSTPATAGVVRLGNNESVAWRNAANSADLSFKVNASNVLEFNGNPIFTLALGAANTVLKMNSGGTAYEFGKITNDNVDNSATIALSKLATMTASRAVQSSAGGLLEASSVTSTELGYLSGVTSAIQNQINSKRDTSDDVDLTSEVTGILAIANGGTGQSTANAALNALLPSQTSQANKVLGTDGTNSGWVAVATTVTTTRGDLIRRGASADERFSAVTDNRVVRGDGTDVILGQIDDPDFFTDGAVATAIKAGIYKAGAAPGYTSGSAIAAGFIGERLTSTGGNTAWTSNQYMDGGNSGLTLTPGVWLIKSQSVYTPSSDSAITSYTYGVGTASGNNATGLTDYRLEGPASHTPSNTPRFVSPALYVNISGNTTYYPKFRITGTRSGGLVSSDLEAIRIA